MIRSASTKKKIAIFFLGLMTLETLVPLKGLALTSGPIQPEMTQFQPAGMSDMVDLFTGDFKYNIPLMDVDGYPVNLTYSQGVGMEDEASWVGLGWNLNVGSITRQLKGIPDDHMAERVNSIQHMKRKVTTGGQFRARMEVTGFNVAKLGGSVSMGVFYDNYTGYGAEVGVGANAGLMLTGRNASGLTLGLNGDMTSNTSSGVSSKLGASLGISMTDDNQMTSSINGNLSLGYNTREGLKSLTMGGSFNPGGLKVMEGYWTRDLNTPVFYPAPEIAFRSSSRTYSLDLGVAATVVNVGFGGTGYKTIREVKSEFNTHFAYGTMYSAEGKDNDNALMDFMREKDNIVIKDMNHIALPISMPDVFNYTSQAGSGQFALYKGGSGMYFNNKKIDETENFTLGGDFGWGWNFHGGISLFEQNIQDITGKWTSGNNIQKSIDFPGDGSDIREEKTYFKTIGEQTIEDANFVSAIRDEMPVSISIKGPDAQNSLQAPNVATANAPSAGYKKNGRQLRNTTIQYLTAAEANTAAVERKIYNYPANKYVNGQFTPQACHQVAGVVPIDRVSYRRKKHHLSEMTVVGGDGKRMVYGLPVYNHSQKEISFATDTMKSRTGRATNLVKYRLDGSRIFHKPAGSNEYYSEQDQPGYASSFMLTAILSPDYVDVTGNGLTEDDRGTYVKFNYTRHSEGYRWRSPTGVQEATVNHGMLADPDDDKASFVYGEKELWYLHSIETKTKVAYFITEADRLDGAGVKGLHGGLYTAATVPADQRQLRLREIRLYSKTDHVTPIKSVILKQSFSLCKGSTLDPNIGKMALDSLYFTYGKSTRGMHHPYVFSYKKTAGASNEYGGYGVLQTDRWGTFKPKNASPGGLLNDEYPYSVGTVPDLWLLNKIELPTGGTIDVKYEADTYSYVQNRQAMKMVSMNDVKMLNASGAHTDVFTDMRKLKLAKVPGVTNLQEFRDKYLSGSKYLYGKMYVNLTDKPRDQNGNNYDWVPCYAEVTGVTPESDSIIVDLEATGVGNRSVNAFLAAAYQRMRLDYPRYAWPGYKNKIADDMPLDAAMNALSNALGNFREIREDFNERALRKGFASGFNKAKSFIRLSAFDKEGGGARVKSLETREIWDGGPEEVSIQRYSYTTEGPNGAVISSGVAAYEPSIGGDENPFRQPDPYTQVNRKALDNEYYLEEPFGEALFPAPTVGYRKVRVENRSAIDESRNTPVSQTGYLQYEFYTAKEFPTEVEWTNLQKYEKRPPAFSSFFGGKAIHELALSQGYLVRMNDMHGKPRAERVFNQLKEEISATEYFYNAEERGGAMRLVNKVDVVGSDGAITKDQILGREMDMIADMREGETSNFGTTIQVGMDVFQLGLFTIPIPHWPKASNIDYRLFRSASVVKTASYYGVVQKIVKKVDGSSVTTYNLLFDKLTGQPVVTAVENEFNDPVYSLNIPAYWINSRMGHAYQTANMIYRQLKVDANGDVSALYRQYLLPGDELVDIERPGQRFWAIQTAKTPGGRWK
ncbi:hypothetical protein [Chitinophaga caseinilytica]|uniref:Uncharacterized protein n=1 Tax=Chitinophaga caseinilytica TaxID=2267521 RepID=A0ABZ2Z1T3_9BACT